MSNSPVDLLADLAADFGVTIGERNRTELQLDVPVPLPDGSAPIYRISLAAFGSKVQASETVYARLPTFCPDRHINRDGSFCIGWNGAEDLRVTDSKTAWHFFAKLIKFLRYQERAARLRRWPDGRVWAHGDAAKHQQIAIQSADAFGPALGDAVRRGRLTFRRRGSGVLGPALQISVDDRWLFSVWEKQERVVNLRRICFCTPAGSPRCIIKKCKEHKEAAVALALAVRDWEVAESIFWKQFADAKCCGTLRHCPLREKE